MTQQPEYEQEKSACWKEFCKTHHNPERNWTAFEYAFDCAYALGNQEKETDQLELCKKVTESKDGDMVMVMQGWVTRDKNGLLSLFQLYRPERCYDYNGDSGRWGTSIGNQMTILPNRLFPDLTWESDPIEVEIQIKRKKI